MLKARFIPALGLALFAALRLSADARGFNLPAGEDPLGGPISPVVYSNTVVNMGTGSNAAPAPSPTPAPAQADNYTPYLDVDRNPDPYQRGLKLGGPRFGCTYMTGNSLSYFTTAVRQGNPNAVVNPLISQFGWQMEYHMYRNPQGMLALTEFIPLVGGLENGMVLPSLTWLVGLRNKQGWEFGIGPNLGLSGVAMMVGAGYTASLEGINIPLNVAVGRGAENTSSLNFSVGFNI